MKRLTLIVAAAFLMLSGPLVFADTQQPVFLNNDQIALIRANCLSVQSTLQRAHTYDALLRVYLAREYDILSSKLMAPMNSRVALNKLNGVSMVEITVDFNQTVNEFKSTYQQYDQTVTKALQIDCRNNPSDFYNTVVQARYYRAQVRADVTTLSDLADQYRTQVVKLSTQSKDSSEDGS